MERASAFKRPRSSSSALMWMTLLSSVVDIGDLLRFAYGDTLVPESERILLSTLGAPTVFDRTVCPYPHLWWTEAQSSFMTYLRSKIFQLIGRIAPATTAFRKSPKTNGATPWLIASWALR